MTGSGSRRVPADFGFYGILTDPRVGYERLTDILVEREVKIIQLRMKGAPKTEVLAVAHKLRERIPRETLFIINDDPEIACAAGADGVHLGQEDMPYEMARRIVGDEAIIGLSTHSPAQTRAACSLAPDYVGVGPVFPTTTKAVPDPVIGLEGMARMLQVAKVPAVVLGGIDETNITQALAAGAKNVCAVRAINATDDPAATLDALLEMIAAQRVG